VHTEAFLDTVEAFSKFIPIVPELSLLPAFQAIQEFKSLPDFLMFPVFLTTISQSHPSALAQGLDMEIIHAVKAFVDFTNEVQKRSQSASDTVTYACQHWTMHLSRASNPRNNMPDLKHVFKVFWDNHLLSWLERQWCLRGPQSCLVLSEGQELAKVCMCVLSIAFA
jgi:hypothetical protein